MQYTSHNQPVKPSVQRSDLNFAQVNTSLKATLASLQAKRGSDMDNKIKKVIDLLSAVGVEVICPQSSLSEHIAAYHTPPPRPNISTK